MVVINHHNQYDPNSPCAGTFMNVAESPIPQPQLQTSRLELRAFSMDDAPAVNELLKEKDIAANTQLIAFPYSTELARQWIAPQENNWQQGKAAVFAVCFNRQQNEQTGTIGKSDDSAFPTTSSTTSLIGVVGLEIDSPHERAELGYWIGKPWWGRGYCTEASAAVIEFGFECLGLNRIFAYHMVHNEASGRVMEKLGMQREGVLKQHVKKWGRFEDTAIYGILRTAKQR